MHVCKTKAKVFMLKNNKIILSGTDVIEHLKLWYLAINPVCKKIISRFPIRNMTVKYFWKDLIRQSPEKDLYFRIKM